MGDSSRERDRARLRQMYIDHLEELQLFLALLVVRYGEQSGPPSTVFELHLSHEEADFLRQYVRESPSVIVTAGEDGYDLVLV